MILSQFGSDIDKVLFHFSVFVRLKRSKIRTTLELQLTTSVHF